jgi:amino acid adenylation domain-containing protein
MTVIELLAQLNEKNVMLSVEGDNLVVRGNEQVLETPALLELLRKNKKALVEHIRAGTYVDPRGIVQVPPNRILPGCEAIRPEMLPLVRLTQQEIDSVVGGVPGGAPNVQDIYPLGPLQEGMLFHHLLAAEGDVYLTPALLAFDTRVLLDGVLQALQAVIDRHDILRTAVLWEGLSEPVQVVWREAPLVVEEVSFDPTTGDVAEEMSARFDPRRYRFDIRQAPLMRVYIAHDALKDRWIMLHLFHHLSIDHVAFDVLLEEVYTHLSGRGGQLPAPLPFRNFVAQARLGVSREEHERFFRAMLGDVDEPTAPYGLVDVQGDGSGIRDAWREVDVRLAGSLRRIARKLSVSVASLGHLACALVLGQVSASASRRDDAVFGTVMFGRMQGVEGADRAFGMLINTLPIRIRVGAGSVEESARQTHELLAELMRHEHASLALAQRCSGVAAQTPLFSAIFNYRYGVAAEVVAGAAEDTLRAWDGIEVLKCGDRSNYPFSVSMDDKGEGFVLGAQVQSPADPDRICAYMHTALERLVEALEQAPTTPVRSLEVLPASERHQLLVEWNAAEIAHPQKTWVHELFEAQVEKTPEVIALVYEERSLTYGELNVRANRLAHHLRALGVGPEARVAICLERSLELVVALLATLKAGGAYVPLDPAYPAERLNYMLEDSAPMVLLTDGAARSALAGGLPAIPLLELERDERQWSGRPEGNPEGRAGGADGRSLAYIIYTSGSTGEPKGVMVGHANVVRLLEATECWFGFGPADVWTLFHSYAFDFSVWEMWGALGYGGRLIIVPQALTRSPEEFHGMLCRSGVTVLNQTPSAFRQLISVGNGSGERDSLRCVIFGGEELDVGMLKPWYEGREDGETQMVNMYGITETTVHVTYRRLEEGETERNGGSPIGRRIADLKTYILDAQSEPAPIGVKGELHIGGAGVARGYLNRPEQTAERFRPDPNGVEAGARIYKSGDLGRWLPEGEIEFLGRNDMQVKIRGFRIELGEIEARLVSHPEVSEAVVVAQEEEGGVGKRLVAYYIGEKVEVEALRAHLVSTLPAYMVPAAYVELEALPLTPNGKLDRRALPAPSGSGTTREYEAPIGATETVLAQIWAEIFKLERVGRDDNFFELGGHSLLAVRLIERMRQEGLRTNVRVLFTHPTLTELAAVAEKEWRL